MSTVTFDELAWLGAGELSRLGSEAMDARNYRLAHHYLREALERDRSANNLSLFALALVRHTGDTRTASALCYEALRMEPRDTEHYLRLGIIYLVAGKRREAIRALEVGQRAGVNEEIAKLLQVLGTRGRPVFPFLSRNNPLNKYLGKMKHNWARAS
jgi:tetratricopeptide (TPR) repeat protein